MRDFMLSIDKEIAGAVVSIFVSFGILVGLTLLWEKVANWHESRK